MEHTVAKSYDEIHNTPTVLCKKSKIVSFVSSIMKNMVVFPPRSKFPVKLICWIAFGSASSACCYHPIIVFEMIIVQETTNSVIISLTCCNFSNTVICVKIIFY